MFDIGFGELLLIGGIALIVIGPREFPHAIHYGGKTLGALRRVARAYHIQLYETLTRLDVESRDKEMSQTPSSSQASPTEKEPVCHPFPH